MTRLPRSLDDVRGLRAARWIRESTAGQYDRFGPDSQHEQIDRFLARYGLVDTGLVFQVAHSGTTVWRSDTMAAMLAAARRGEFDLLLTGYSDRWQRNLRRTLELLEDGLHPAGTALVMCDRRILSSDPHDWDELVAEAAAAERYSRRLSERISDGYAAKFEREHDQAGSPGLGFRRRAEPPHTLEVDPDTIGRAVRLFERYALGNVSIEQLGAETDLAPDRIRAILANRIYNGWIRRHRGREQVLQEAAWRAQPPVSDALWDRVAEVRAAKTRGGGPRNRGRVDLLAGLLYCVCGRRIRSDGQLGDSARVAKLHVDPCGAWGPKARFGSDVWERPLRAQLAGIRLDAETRTRVVAALTSARPPIAMDRARLERAKRELALEHAAERLSDETYLARLAQLRTQLAELGQTAEPGVNAARAVEWMEALAETWDLADLPAQQTDVLHAVYARIEVAGAAFRKVTLTPSAYAHGLALALPQAVMARPAGFEPAT